MIIRKINSNDYMDYKNLIEEAFGIIISEKNFIGLLECDRKEILVIIKDEKVVGSLIIDKLRDYVIDKNYYFVSYVCVKEGFRNQGIGSFLIDFLVRKAKENGISYIDLTSKPSKQFANKMYLKAGFINRNTNVFRKEI